MAEPLRKTVLPVGTCRLSGTGGGVKELADVDRLLVVADLVMRRRGKALTPALDAIYRAAAGRGDSGNAVPWRRSA